MAKERPTARVCEYCLKSLGVDKFRREVEGRSVLVWAHLGCFRKNRGELRRPGGEGRRKPPYGP